MADSQGGCRLAGDRQERLLVFPARLIGASICNFSSIFGNKIDQHNKGFQSA